MAKVDLWQARLAVKTLRRDQREAIAEAMAVAMIYPKPEKGGAGQRVCKNYRV